MDIHDNEHSDSLIKAKALLRAYRHEQGARERIKKWRIMSGFLKTAGFLCVITSSNPAIASIGAVLMLLAWYVYDFGLYVYDQHTVDASFNAAAKEIDQ